MNQDRFSLEDHNTFGEELQKTRDSLMKWDMTLNEFGYPKAARESLKRSIRHIDKVRCLMDDYVFQDHGDAGHTSIYYRHSLGERL